MSDKWGARCKVGVGSYLFGGVKQVTWHAFRVISYRCTLWDFVRSKSWDE
jgi:hypothetical protein